MATKLRNPNIHKVDLVDDPANPMARIMLYKRNDQAGKPKKTENGVEYPAEAYAYVPDSNKPSTWKLRLWETPEKKETAAQVGRAIAALGEGFRGNKVEIPEEDLPKVKEKVRAAWKKTHPDADESEMPAVIKKSVEGGDASGGGVIARMLRAIGKKLGWADADVEEVTKEATSFAQELAEQRYRQVLSELWDYTWALQEAIENTLKDDTVDREALIRGSIDQFAATIENALPSWLQGEQVEKGEEPDVEKAGRVIAASRLQRLKDAHAALGAIIEEAEPQKTEKKEGEEGVSNQIDKSKLAPEILAYIEDLEKKAGQVEDLEKRATEAEGKVTELEQEVKDLKKRLDNPDDPEDDIYKGLPENVRKVLKARDEEIAKLRDERDTETYIAKAREFKALPIQPEEFGKTLKALAKAAPEAYAELDKVLKATDEAIAQGKVFEEIGKSGGSSAGGAWAKIEKAADEIMKSNPNLTRPQAIEKACKQNPDLVEEYRKEAR